jgi:hypothetical protein
LSARRSKLTRTGFKPVVLIAQNARRNTLFDCSFSHLERGYRGVWKTRDVAIAPLTPIAKHTIFATFLGVADSIFDVAAVA